MKLQRVKNIDSIKPEDIAVYFYPENLDEMAFEIEIQTIEVDEDIDYINLASELQTLIENNPNTEQTDPKAANIIWNYCKTIEPKTFASKGEMLFLALQCKKYICHRWYDKLKNNISQERFDLNANRGMNRHGIGRLYWAAKITNGDETLLKNLFKSQDVAVAILERAWSHSPNFVAWFFDVINKPMEKILEEELLQSKYYQNKKSKKCFDAINQYEMRLLIKLFYGLASQEYYDLWDNSRFNEVFTKAINYALYIRSRCQESYEVYCDRLGINKVHSELELSKKIAKLNHIPYDLDQWIQTIHDP